MGAVRKGSAHFLYPSACRRNHRNRQQEKTKKPYEAGEYTCSVWLLLLVLIQARIRPANAPALHAGHPPRQCYPRCQRRAQGRCRGLWSHIRRSVRSFRSRGHASCPSRRRRLPRSGSSPASSRPRQRATGGPDRRCRGRSCPLRCSLQRGSRACLRGCWGP